jgi:hypothetical protein
VLCCVKQGQENIKASRQIGQARKEKGDVRKYDWAFAWHTGATPIRSNISTLAVPPFSHFSATSSKATTQATQGFSGKKRFISSERFLHGELLHYGGVSIGAR